VTDLRERARRELERLQPSPDGLERTLRVVRRRRRNRRLAAGALGLLLTSGIVTGLLAIGRPAHRPATTAPEGLIAFSRGGPHGGIYVMSPDGSGLTRLTSVTGDAQPAWSQDEWEIAFVRFQHGNEDIFTMHADGSGVTRLTSDGASSSPAWSPDGTRIAFARECCGDTDIYVMDPDGTHVVNLTNDPLIENTPSWSPDGSQIAFTGYSQGPSGPLSPTRLYLMNADGSGMRRIGPDDVGLPRWSPDGTQLAFVNEDTGSIYAINADGSGLRRVVDVDLLPGVEHTASNFTVPAWSPDGGRIVFAAGDATSSDLYLVDADGSGLEQLTHDSEFEEDPAWSPLPGTPPPTVVPSPSPVETRCVRARTAGDFDGDGTTDRAEFVVIDRGHVSCADREAVGAHFKSQELVVQFGSGQTLDQRFPADQCSGGSCAHVFEATDLDGDGRGELAVDVGPGAAVAYVEFFRVEPTGFHRLMIAEPGDPPYLKPGPAVIGGGFDSGLQSPVECRVNADGTRELVSIHAESIGRITEPWQVHTTVLVLQGDRLVVTATSDTTEPLAAFAGPLFRNGCP
jgi:TolB protein